MLNSPHAYSQNKTFTKHIVDALMQSYDEKLNFEVPISRKLNDEWEPTIKIRIKDHECFAFCDLGASVSVGILGTGVPRLACLRPTVWLEEWPSTTHLHQHMLKTLARGQASRGGRQESFLRSSLVRVAREEAERSRQGYLARCL